MTDLEKTRWRALFEVALGALADNEESPETIAETAVAIANAALRAEKAQLQEPE
jgi:hypothetical protein